MYFFAATLIFTVLYLTVSAFAEMDEDEDGEITQEEFIKVKASATQMKEYCNCFPQICVLHQQIWCFKYRLNKGRYYTEYLDLTNLV